MMQLYNFFTFGTLENRTQKSTEATAQKKGKSQAVVIDPSHGNMRLAFVASALAAAALTYVANADFYPKKTGVVNVNIDNFDIEILRDNQVSLVEFYAPW